MLAVYCDVTKIHLLWHHNRDKKPTPKAYKDETQKICMQRSPAVSVAENGNYQANTDGVWEVPFKHWSVQSH